MSLKKANSILPILLTSTLVFIIWQSPILGSIRYPFILLGTWFHEMGHGLTALMLGGTFHYLEIYANGGGVAYTSLAKGTTVPYSIARAFTAMGGLLGPSIFGGLLIIASARPKWTLWGLRLLIFLLIASLFIWIRSWTGLLVLGLFSMVLLIISFQNKNALNKWVLLFLGTQCALSSYLQIDYLFTGTFKRNGEVLNSDTQNIAENLFGTYWFWGILVGIVSLLILWKSYRFYFKYNTAS